MLKGRLSGYIHAAIWTPIGAVFAYAFNQEWPVMPEELALATMAGCVSIGAITLVVHWYPDSWIFWRHDLVLPIPDKTELIRKLDELYALGVANRNNLSSPAVEFNSEQEKEKFQQWNEAVINILDGVSIADRSWFRTLNRFVWRYTKLENDDPMRHYYEAIYNEKTDRLRQIISRNAESGSIPTTHPLAISIAHTDAADRLKFAQAISEVQAKMHETGSGWRRKLDHLSGREIAALYNAIAYDVEVSKLWAAYRSASETWHEAWLDMEKSFEENWPVDKDKTDHASTVFASAEANQLQAFNDLIRCLKMVGSTI